MSRKFASSPKQQGRFFTVDEIADVLGVSSKTVRRRISEGDLPVHRIGRQLRVSEGDFGAYVALQRKALVST